MCCRLILAPVPGPLEYLERQFAIADFVRADNSKVAFWSRTIKSEKSIVRARLTEHGLELSLYPSVTNYAGHEGLRLGASLMFQMAALLAEGVGGTIAQHATVAGCMAERPSIAIVAHYPEMPLLWENVCRGFREVMIPHAS